MIKEVLKPLSGNVGPLGVCRKNTKFGEHPVTIDGKTYLFEQRAVLFTELSPDTTNPRYAMDVKNGLMSDDDMLLKLKGEARHKTLRESIRITGSLVEPIYVREEDDDKKCVYEGNRRWAALSELYAEDNQKYKYVPAYIIPDDMPQEAWLKLLSILHEQRKADWSTYSRAVNIRTMMENGIQMDEIVLYTGRSQKEVSQSIETAKMVEEYAVYSKDVDENPEGKYAQLWEVAPMEFSKTKKGRETAYRCIMDGQVKSAKDIRCLRDLHRDDPISFAKVSEAEVTLNEAKGIAKQKDEVGGSAKRFKTLGGILIKSFTETKKTLVNNPDVLKEAEKLFKLLGKIIEDAKGELEPEVNIEK